MRNVTVKDKSCEESNDLSGESSISHEQKDQWEKDRNAARHIVFAVKHYTVFLQMEMIESTDDQ